MSSKDEVLEAFHNGGCCSGGMIEAISLKTLVCLLAPEISSAAIAAFIDAHLVSNSSLIDVQTFINLLWEDTTSLSKGPCVIEPDQVMSSSVSCAKKPPRHPKSGQQSKFRNMSKQSDATSRARDARSCPPANGHESEVASHLVRAHSCSRNKVRDPTNVMLHRLTQLGGIAQSCSFEPCDNWNIDSSGRNAEHKAKESFQQLLSAESASNGLLEWTLYLQADDDSWLAGVVPAAIAKLKPDYLLQKCRIGVKGTGAGGCKKEQFSMNKHFLRVACDFESKVVTFFVGDTLDSMTQRSRQELSKLEARHDVALAVGILPGRAAQVRLVSTPRSTNV